MRIIRNKKHRGNFMGGNKSAGVLLMAVLGILFSAGFSSCVDDLDVKTEVPAEDFTGITLMVPDLAVAAEFGASRSQDGTGTRAYNTAIEGNFNTLYIVAVKKVDDNTTSIKTFLKNQSDGIVGDYRKYTVNLEPGYYKFYVVSNLNRYLLDENNNNITFADAATSESAIRKLILNFRSYRPLEPGFLPMACMNEDLKLKDNPSSDVISINGDNFISISRGASKYIYADLKFLCSKVRYTIIFDRDQSSFANGDVIDVHRNVAADYPYATNIRFQTAIYTGEGGGTANSDFISESTESDAKAANWPIFLDRYIYDGSYSYQEDDRTISGTTDIYSETDEKKIYGLLNTLEPWTDGAGSWTSDTFLKRRAWQGVTYLPENLLENNPTLLKFPYSFNGQTGASSPREVQLKDFPLKAGGLEKGIKRGMMYDVYILIKTPDAEQWELSVIPRAWELENLAYELHGPYELVVETTEIEKLSMAEDAVFWFRSDLPPSEIGFISPKVSRSKENGTDMVDLFEGKVEKDAQGNYITDENGNYLFRVKLNPDLPFKVIDQLNNGGLKYGDYTYTTEDVNFFHIVAGSLNKRIEIKSLDLDPYLNVSPQTIIIDTRELYTSGYNSPTDTIRFETNVDLTDATYAVLELSDPDKLISEPKGDGALSIKIPISKDSKKEIFSNSGAGNYKYIETNLKDNYILLDINDIITGNSFWDRNNEFNLTFTLTIYREGQNPYKITKPVNIKIRPFSGTFVIHFRDNTKNWEQAHIYIYQDLTLPSDMVYVDENNEEHPYPLAGKIVGYIEENPTSGFQWNAAAQYVFTNNLAFRGWHGNHKARKNPEGKYTSFEGNEYGGPDDMYDKNGNLVLNDPWAEATMRTGNPTGNETEINKDFTTTMGFVMFGKPDIRQADQTFNHDKKDKWFKFWNYDYAYNKTYILAENPQRWARYNYDVKFNADHVASGGDWGCGECANRNPDFNGPSDDKFYPGIAMEKEADGWWKYTLTGVAQPGRTMIIFANWHEPWSPDNKWFDYRAEDYRWPGDYEAGLPLFDFEDNEGWFLFDGNTSNNDQKFTDNRPVSREIPHKFNSTYTSSMRIEVKNPGSGSISNIKINGTTYNNGLQNSANKTTYFDVDNISATGETFTVTVTANGSYKDYVLYPKNFKYDSASGRYKTAQPLYFEYTEGIRLYVKWNDQVHPDVSYWGSFWTDARDRLLYYDPPAGGSNYLNVYWGPKGDWTNLMKSYHFTGKEIGNYKFIDFTTTTPGVTVKDKLQLRLCTTQAGDKQYYKVIGVEELPQYYYPGEDKYLINWHFLQNP